MFVAAKSRTSVVAAGHEATAMAAAEILAAGGNAYDAVIAGYLAACVAEPVLASLGGGGHLLAAPRDGKPLVYDFFVQTPLQHYSDSLDFRPIHGDFGDATQEFHIGVASIATPGAAAGINSIHHDLCRMPLTELVQPACKLAREGLELNAFQAYIHQILQPILTSNSALRRLYAPQGELLKARQVFRAPAMAEGFEALAREGADWFYLGEPAEQVAEACAQRGGHLGRQDFARYQLKKREPLCRRVGNARVYTNPLPSVGGSLILFLLEMMQRALPSDCSYQDPAHLRTLAHAMRSTNLARRQSGMAVDPSEEALSNLMQEDFIASCARAIQHSTLATRGTTQISVIDDQGNLASLTVTNGEGSGLLLENWGIHLNNMLGEEDLNPHGFHRWASNQRLASMMAPTVVVGRDGSLTTLGSGGSNRIRTAIAQVLVNQLLFERGLETAVCDPRIHLEADLLNLEPGIAELSRAALLKDFPGHLQWGEQNLFFGGVHAVQRVGDQTLGMADPRRGGFVAVA